MHNCVNYKLHALTALLGTGVAFQAAASPQFMVRPLVSGYALAADASDKKPYAKGLPAFLFVF